MIDGETQNEILEHARAIGRILEGEYPRLTMAENTRTWEDQGEDGAGVGAIASHDADDIADALTLVIAEVLQAWLDAGSERDATLETLGPHMLEEVRGWTIREGAGWQEGGE